MYVKIYHRHQGHWEPSMLMELTAKALKRYKREYPNRLCLVVTGQEAHRWVRDGHPHSTPLYIDYLAHNKCIRYARGAR